ncbi:MAG: glutathione S-transferase family protein, partial [Rhodoferax sp.]
MNDLILHHYPTSPFSEKVRLILGYKKLAWKSVVIPPIMPKPDVVALTGGYRKTPFLQIGADIYCDTALICDILEHRQPAPTLYPAHNKGLARVLAQWADSTLFWTAMAWNFSPAGAAQVFPGAPPETMKAFAEDRTKMRVAVPRMPPPDAAAAYRSYLRRLANMLDEQPFLLGAAPCIADFAAYHPLWFTRHRTPAMAGVLEATPGVLAWMDRMAVLGHHEEQAFRALEAITLAAASTPAALKEEPFQDEHGIPLG